MNLPTPTPTKAVAPGYQFTPYGTASVGTVEAVLRGEKGTMIAVFHYAHDEKAQYTMAVTELLEISIPYQGQHASQYTIPKGTRRV